MVINKKLYNIRENEMKKLSIVGIVSLTLLSMSALFAQESEEMMTEGSIMDKISVGANLGLTEPWGEPGSGTFLTTGFTFRAFAQYDLGDYVKNLKGELSFGYSKFSAISSGDNRAATVIPILVNGVYKIADITPDISVFGYGGLGLNLHSWDAANVNAEITNQTVLGFNVGVGGSYPINEKMELNLRVGTYISSTSSQEFTFEGSTFESADDYGHMESSILVCITYKL